MRSGGRVTSLGALTLNGGILAPNGGWAGTWNTTYQLVGDVTVGGTSTSAITSTTADATNRVRLSPSGSRTFNVAEATGDAGADLTIDTTVVDGKNGASSLVKTGAGTLTLSGDTSYTGTTTVNGGTLTMVNSAAGNAIRGNHTYMVNSPGTLVFSRNGGAQDPGNSPPLPSCRSWRRRRRY